jgi:DNA gyrase subunit A
LIVTKRGHGKIVGAEDYPTRGRGGKGVRTFKALDGQDAVAAVAHVQTGSGQRVLIVTAGGMALMTEVDNIATRSRTAGGVKLMDVEEGDEVVAAIV